MRLVKATWVVLLSAWALTLPSSWVSYWIGVLLNLAALILSIMVIVKGKNKKYGIILLSVNLALWLWFCFVYLGHEFMMAFNAKYFPDG